MELVFVTGNKHKILEVNSILQNKSVKTISHFDLGWEGDIEETGNTFEENAILKAKTIYDLHHLPTMAEDSGLEVYSLNNEPGVFSARYAGENKSDADNTELLLKKMKDVEDRSARFVTVVAYIDHDGIKTFRGEIYGKIGHNPRGNSGFGYDPVFIPDGNEMTFAELPLSEKNSISHRAIAMQKFIDHLSSQ